MDIVASVSHVEQQADSAYAHGEQITACPYPDGSTAALVWRLRFSFAQISRRRDEVLSRCREKGANPPTFRVSQNVETIF